MPLPFLKGQPTSTIIKKRQPDGSMEEQYPEAEDSDSHGLEACARDIIEAVSARDEKAMANAIRAAFTIIEAEEPKTE